MREAKRTDDRWSARALDGASFPTRARRAFEAAAISLLLAACGGGDSEGVTAPEPEAPREISEVARTYLTELVDIMRANSFKRLTIDWTEFRTTVIDAAGAAQTIPQTRPAAAVALGLLADDHSRLTTPEGEVIVPSTRRSGCAIALVEDPVVPDDIGYVRVSAFSGSGAAGNAFADELQAEIRARDREGLVGWIVDLRGNTGGNIWVMLAGIGPVLGEGVVGHFFDPEGRVDVWEYRDGAGILNGVPLQRAEMPHQLLQPHPRVAVLLDRRVISAGEAVAVAFRGRPETRSFGTATCGLSTGILGFDLSDGAVLGLAVVTFADRDMVEYVEGVTVDQQVPDPDGVVDRAIEWLRNP